jgi:hypothetical protein
MTHHFHYGDNLTALIVTVERALQLRERAVQLPARRDDAFKHAAREDTTGKQGAQDL